VACAVLLLNVCELANPNASAAVRDGHLFSAYLMLPLATTTLGLLTFNWYPSQVGGRAGRREGGGAASSCSGCWLAARTGCTPVAAASSSGCGCGN
jgi:hypothetical protein